MDIHNQLRCRLGLHYGMVLMIETLHRLKENFFKDITALLAYSLDDLFQVGQLDGVTIRNPVRPVIVNYYIDAFGTKALRSVLKRATILHR